MTSQGQRDFIFNSVNKKSNIAQAAPSQQQQPSSTSGSEGMRQFIRSSLKQPEQEQTSSSSLIPSTMRSYGNAALQALYGVGQGLLAEPGTNLDTGPSMDVGDRAAWLRMAAGNPEAPQRTQAELQAALPTNPDVGSQLIKHTLPAALTSRGREGLVRSAIGGGAATIAEQLGAPEWVQSGLKFGAQVAPKMSSKLTPSPKYAEEVKMLKDLGVKDETIALQLNTPQRRNMLARYMSKSDKAKSRVEGVQTDIGNAMSRLKSNPAASKRIGTASEAQQAIGAIPQEVKSSLYQAVPDLEKDVAKFLNSPITGESVINLRRKLNGAIARYSTGVPMQGAVKPGEVNSAVHNFKQITDKLLDRVEPGFLKKFTALDKAYGNTMDVLSKFPSQPASNAEALAMAALKAAPGIGTAAAGSLLGPFGAAAAPAAMYGAKLGTTEMLLNPRFAELGHQVSEATKRNALSALTSQY